MVGRDGVVGRGSGGVRKSPDSDHAPDPTRQSRRPGRAPGTPHAPWPARCHTVDKQPRRLAGTTRRERVVSGGINVRRFPRCEPVGCCGLVLATASHAAVVAWQAVPVGWRRTLLWTSHSQFSDDSDLPTTRTPMNAAKAECDHETDPDDRQTRRPPLARPQQLAPRPTLRFRRAQAVQPSRPCKIAAPAYHAGRLPAFLFS